MAGASDKINSLIAREFSFVQELVWLPPRRNPFPRCTDKIVSDLRRLEVLFRRPLTNVPVRGTAGAHNSFTSSRRAADHAVCILNADAEQLIALRRSLCKQTISVQQSSSLNDFENQAEALIMQHLDSAWGCKNGSVEVWASKVEGLDFQALDKALQHRFESFFSHVIDHHLLQTAKHGDDIHSLGPNFLEGTLGHRTNHETQSASDATSLHDDDENDDDDDVSEVDSNEGGSASHNQGLPLVLVSKGHESKPDAANTNNRKSPPAQIEMTMKARICADHITFPDEYCWHIIFGLVNHDHIKVAVHSLSYWSLDNESEVSTIKWPKGGVILKEAPSFLCYSCQVRCTGPPDSPRVAFSWQYRSLQKYPVAIRGGIKEAVKDRAIEPPSLELRDGGAVGVNEDVKDLLCIADSSFTDLAKVDVPALSQTPCPGSSDPFYKRLGDFLPWKDSRKKAKMSTA